MSEMLSERAARRARIVFDTFRSVHDPRLSAWLLFRSHLLPEWSLTVGTLTESTPDAGLTPLGVFGVWRLLATNNRELGRGVAIFASPADAVTAAREACAVAPSLSFAPVRGREPTRHGWVLCADDQPVVMAARWYESSSEAAVAARGAAAALAEAEIAAGVSIGTASGRRAHRSLAP